MHVCNNAYIALMFLNTVEFKSSTSLCTILCIVIEQFHKIKRECVELAPKINQLKKLMMRYITITPY